MGSARAQPAVAPGVEALLHPFADFMSGCSAGTGAGHGSRSAAARQCGTDHATDDGTGGGADLGIAGVRGTAAQQERCGEHGHGGKAQGAALDGLTGNRGYVSSSIKSP